ncbi:MAG: amidohydrolase family protein [Acidobacteriota bacterium]
MRITNCHCHIFTVRHVPADFLPFGLMRFVGEGDSNRFIALLLRSVNPFDGGDRFSRAASFARAGNRASQREVFERMASAYEDEDEGDGPARFVVLPMDMDFMTEGSPRAPYLEQLAELRALRRELPATLLPFVAADPRREGLLELVREHLDDGFRGIKIYPPLGYYPSDERLFPVYALAQERNVPVLSHCSRGGVYFCQTLEPDHFEPPISREILRRRSLADLTDFFTEPGRMRPVLEQFPDLRVCLAHLGGEDEWDRHLDGNPSWVGESLDMMREFPNLWADLSFTAHDRGRFEAIRALVEDDTIGPRILYGTDSYMVQQRATERQFHERLRTALGDEGFRRIAETNPARFLGEA